jgi:hypothetical protein
LTPIEIELSDIIKSSKKTVYVRNSGIIPLSIATELEDRQNKGNNAPHGQVRGRIEIMVADITPIQRLWKTHHGRVRVYVNQKYAEEPELLVADEEIVVLRFNSAETVEIIRDKELARICIAKLKNDRKGDKRFFPAGHDSGLPRFIFLDLLRLISFL